MTSSSVAHHAHCPRFFLSLCFLLAFLMGAVTLPAIAQDWEHHSPPGLLISSMAGAEWDSNLLFVGTANKGLYRLDRTTGEWSAMTLDNDNLAFVGEDVEPFWFSSTILDTVSGRSLFWGNQYQIKWIGTNAAFPDFVSVQAGDHVHFSQDGGDSWSRLSHRDILSCSINEGGVSLLKEDGSLILLDPETGQDETLTTIANANDLYCFSVIPTHTDSLLLGIGEGWSVSPNAGQNWNFLEYYAGMQIEVDEVATDDVWILSTSLFLPDPHLLMFHPSDGTVEMLAHGSINPLRMHRSPQGNIAYNLYDLHLFRSLDTPEVEDTLIVELDTPPWMAPNLWYKSTMEGWLGAEEDTVVFASIHDLLLQPWEGEGSRVDLTGTDNSSIWTMATHPFSPDTCFAGGIAGLYRTFDGGVSWDRVLSKLVYDVAVTPTDSNVVFAVEADELLRSMDGGDSWTVVCQWSTSSGRPSRITPHPLNPDILGLVAKPGQIKMTLDGGDTWVDRAATEQLEGISEIVFDPTDSTRLYVGDEDQLLFSTDMGETWDHLPVDGIVRDITITHGSGWRMIVATENDLYLRTTLDGIWTSLNDPGFYPTSDVNVQLMTDPLDTDVFWLMGLGAGLVSMHTDTLNIWRPLELPNPDQARCFTLAQETIYFGTSFDGTYTLDRTLLHIGEPGGDNASPSSLNLSTPWPNPFNSTLQLEFVLPTPGRAQVVVYDIRGRLVEELLSETMTAGEHRMAWQPDGLASGVYLVQVRAGNLTSMRKVVYLK